MATNDDYLALRRKTGEVESPTYTNTDLDLYIERAAGDLDAAAAEIWAEKASAYADLVNMQEAGSSRSNSDLFDHAVKQRDHFLSASGGAVDTAGSSTTRAIVRL